MKLSFASLKSFIVKKWYFIAILFIVLTSAVIFFRNLPPKAPSVKASKTEGFVFEAKNKNFTAQIGAAKSPKPFIAFTSKTGSSVSMQMDATTETSIQEKDNKVSFLNVNSNTDVVYTPLVNGIKEEIIINQFSENSDYIFDIVTVNASPRKTLEGKYSRFFYNTEGRYQFHLEKPFAIDARGVRTEDVAMQIRQSKEEPNKYQIQLSVKPDWLKSKDRSYPITIDPTIITDTSAEFVLGTLNRLKDTGSGSSPILENYYQELSADQYTVGLWHMNETVDNSCSGGQDACDSGVNSLHGTATGTSINTSSPRLGAGARTFNGSSDYLLTGAYNHVANSPLSGEAWIYLTSYGSGGSVIFSHALDGNGGWPFFVGASSASWGGATCQQKFGIFDGVAYRCSNRTVDLNQWHHVAFTYSGNSVALYYDGILDSSYNVSVISGGNYAITIGGRWFAASNTGYFAGSIDEVRISNIARTPEEIKASASRRPYGIFTSEVLSLSAYSWDPLSWTELGVATGDGETPKDSSGLVAQWNFNETSGTTATNNTGSCGASCNGTLTNFASTASQDQAAGTGWTANNKRWGTGALMFDGVDDSISIPNNTNLNPTIITLETWFKPTSLANPNNIIDKRNAANTDVNYLLQVQPVSGLIRFYSGGSKFDLYSKTSIKPGVWSHIVTTYDGANAKIYINGVLDNSVSYTGSLSTTTDNSLFICRHGVISTGYNCSGILDSTRIYSRALASSEILSNYQSGSVELQTRVGSTTTPDDGTWEEWRPMTSELQIESFDNYLAATCTAVGGVTNDGGKTYIFSDTDKSFFSYTGADQTYTVPAGVTSLNIKMWGGGGGGGYAGGWTYGYSGGGGGYTSGTLAVTPGQTITVMVGAGGVSGSVSSSTANYGGGGRTCITSDCRYGGQGGGRSAIRISNVDYLTAGGGGGGGSTSGISSSMVGGGGGGNSGVTGTATAYPTSGGGGGGQASGGAAGVGNASGATAGTQYLGGSPASGSYGGSGGGGWYGGGGGAYNNTTGSIMGGGGGGSGYIGGVGVSAATTTAGSGINQALSTDPDNGGAGRAGLEGTTGASGRVVISPVYPAKSFSCTTEANVEVLVVAGGGGGGSNMGGGGGGGGVIYRQSYPIAANTSIPVIVGAGGFGAPAGFSFGAHPYVAGTNGENSTFGTLTAIGGGWGGTSYNSTGFAIHFGNSGGSGGGSSGYNNNAAAAGAYGSGAGTAGQGYRGGLQGAAYYSGGGGGAGAAGADGNNKANGGIGIYSDILGTGYYWGGGGGGAGYSIGGGDGGAGGGGGGAASVTSGGSGLNTGSQGGGGCISCWTDKPGGKGGTNTGGGGGGGGHFFSNNKGGDGGSGIVVVRLTPLSKDAVIKTEGASSQKITKGNTQVDNNTVSLWRMDEQAGSSYVVGTGSLPFATGGTVTYSGGYTIHTFYESGVFKVNGTGNVETLVVAGGGGGGSDMGGGGGGGGVLSSNSYAVSPANYTITVGAGGAGAAAGLNQARGTSGTNSVFGTLTAIGGGGGGSEYSTNGNPPASGGSGGGVAGCTNNTQAAGTPGQGNSGGTTTGCYYPGGGGGAGGAGGTNPANGGNGIYNNILGVGYYWGAGGGGAGYSNLSGNGGIGGGGGGAPKVSGGGLAGTGGIGVAQDGAAGTLSSQTNVPGGAGGKNTGSGGGGGSHYNTNNAGGAGGSGIVVIRYLSSLSPVTLTLNNSAVSSSVVPGIVGNARSFDGTSHYVDAGSTASLKFNLTDNFSISGWIYTVADSQDRVIAGNAWGTSPGYHLRMTTANQLRFIVLQDGTNYKYVDSTAALSVGWHHVVGIWNGSTVSMYVDGAITGSQVTSGTVSNITSTSNFFIGNISGQSKYFKGSIDELKVSNVALAAEEVAEMYRMGRDKYINKTIPAVDLSGKKTIPFYIAADRPGAYLTAMLGESDYANYQPDANTVGLWHLDEKDRSGLHVINSNSSSFTGAASGTTVVPGKIGLSRNFSAATNYISIGNFTPIDGIANLTVDAWVFPTAQTAATHFRVFSKQFNVYVGQYGNQVSFYMGSGAAWVVSDITGGTLALNQWNHVTWVKSGTSYYIYINGQLTKSGTGAPATLATNSNTTFIGSYDGTTQNWMGKIDEVRISNSARTAEEISQAYNIDSRSHPITIDFAAKIISQIGPGGGSSVTSSSQSFGYSVSAYGESGDTSKIFPGDKVIIKGVDDGIEYRAQATVKSKTSSSITITSWDAGSTFPPAGFNAGSDVFKWQREYWNITEPLDSALNAVTKFTLRLTAGNEGGTIWLDDLKSAGDYLTTNTGSDILSSTGNFYLQYRAILTSFDENTSPSISSTSVSATVMIPDPPSNLSAMSATTNTITWGFADNSVNETGFKLLNSNTLSAVVIEPTPDITSIIETGLTPNTLYSRRVASYNTYGNSIPSSSVSKYTLASVPEAPTVTRSATSSTVVINPNTNPSTTLLAIYKEAGPTCDGSGGNYIAANGTDNGDTAVWRQLSSWGSLGTVTIPNQNEEIAYTFCLKARNSENIETAFGQPGKSSEKIVPISGDLTLDSPVSNSFLTRYRDGRDPSRYIIGLDTVGENNLNSSQLNINAGSVTINSNESLVAGKLIMGGGSLFLATQGAVIAPGAKLWTIDRDADGYPDRLGGEIKLWYGNDTPTSTISSAWFRRKGLLTSLKNADCNDNAYSATNSCCLDYTYYLDADNDGYGSTTASVVCQESPTVPPGYASNNTDCNDANASKWQNINGYLDADGDTYGAGALTPACSGATLASGYSANNTDCNDANAAKWQNINGYLDADGDTYGAGSLTPVCSGATLASGYSANASDCGPNTATAYPGSATCSSVSFLNAASATSYDYNCSGTDTVCGTAVYVSQWLGCHFRFGDCYCADARSLISSTANGFPLTYSACGTVGSYMAFCESNFHTCSGTTSWCYPGSSGTQYCQ